MKALTTREERGFWRVIAHRLADSLSEHTNLTAIEHIDLVSDTVSNKREPGVHLAPEFLEQINEEKKCSE